MQEDTTGFISPKNLIVEYPVVGTPITTVKLYYNGYEDTGSTITSKRKIEKIDPSWKFIMFLSYLLRISYWEMQHDDYIADLVLQLRSSTLMHRPCG